MDKDIHNTQEKTHTDSSEPIILSEEEIQDRKENKDTAAASYFLILAPLLLITRKDSKFIQFHAAQATILFLFFVLLWILGGVLEIFRWGTVFVFFAAIIGFVQAIQGERYKIPYIYDMVKDGISAQSIIDNSKKAFQSIWKMISGLFPKKTEEGEVVKKSEELSKNIEKKIESDEKTIEELKSVISALEKRIDILEKKYTHTL